MNNFVLSDEFPAILLFLKYAHCSKTVLLGFDQGFDCTWTSCGFIKDVIKQTANQRQISDLEQRGGGRGRFFCAGGLLAFLPSAIFLSKLKDGEQVLGLLPKINYCK